MRMRPVRTSITALAAAASCDAGLAAEASEDLESDE